MFEITTTYKGIEYKVSVTADGHVDIYQGGVWAGSGRWTGQRIDDCDAILGARTRDDSQSDEVYEHLDELLADPIATAMRS